MTSVLDSSEIPSEEWSLDDLGRFCCERRGRMACDAWDLGLALTLAKARCKQNRQSFTDWKRANGFSNASVSRYRRLYDQYPGKEGRAALAELGLMEAMRRSGIMRLGNKCATVGEAGRLPSLAASQGAVPQPEGCRESGRPLNPEAMEAEGLEAPSESFAGPQIEGLRSESGLPLAVSNLGAERYEDVDHENGVLAEAWSIGQTVEEECRSSFPLALNLLRERAENVLRHDPRVLAVSWPVVKEERVQIVENINTLLRLLPTLESTIAVEESDHPMLTVAG